MKRIRGIGGFRSRLFRWIAGVLVVVAQGASAQVPTPVGAAGHVSPGEFADYTLLYDLDIPNNLGTGPTGSPPYTTDNSSSVTPGSFDRIAYYMELNNGSGSRFIWVSMDAFTSNPTKIGVPTQASGAVFQQMVGNMNVESKVPGIVTGTGIATGSIEFWPYNYVPDVVLPGIGGNSSTYDINDKIQIYTPGYGSMQIHNWGVGQTQTLLAYNSWGNTVLASDDVGIGNNTLVNSFDNRLHPDWTFSRNAGNYPVKILRVYIHVDCSAAGQAGTSGCNQPPVADAGADQTVECAGASTSVTLDGTASSDPDGDALTYAWSENGIQIASGATAIVSLSHGGHTITLQVTDPAGVSDIDDIVVNIADTTPPSITLNGDAAMRVVYQSTYTEAGATLSDVCDPNPVLTISGVVNTGLVGTYTLTYQGRDASGNASAEVTRTVEVYKTPTQRIGDLMALINSLVASGAIPPGNGTAFIASLRAATSSLSAGNTADALSELNAFINKVKAQSGKKVTTAVAAQLIAGGQQIIAQLGGAAKLAGRPAPTRFALAANYPNPFNPSTTIPYVLNEVGLVKLSVYNVLGQQIRVLVDQLQVPGSYTVSWDGMDASGLQVAGGVYFYRLQAGDHIQVMKMLFAK